jgi:hypothetical protein
LAREGGKVIGKVSGSEVWVNELINNLEVVEVHPLDLLVDIEFLNKVVLLAVEVEFVHLRIVQSWQFCIPRRRHPHIIHVANSLVTVSSRLLKMTAHL